MKYTFVIAVCLLAVSPCLSAKEKGGIGPQTDFRTMPPEQVLTLLQNADSIKVDAKGVGLRLEGGDKNFEAGCNGKAGWAGEGACSQLLSGFFFGGRNWANRSNSEIAFAMEALLRGCGIYARSPNMAAGGKTCLELGEVLNAIGNSAAAAAVWEQAPGCLSFDDSGPVNGCVIYAIQSARSVYASYPLRLERMARNSCDTLHDRTACEYLRSMGESVNMNAVASADADRQEARQEAREQRAASLAQEQDNAEARRNAMFSALQSMPGGNDPNAVLNAGNQQTAAIRAIGDAHAARQQENSANSSASQTASSGAGTTNGSASGSQSNSGTTASSASASPGSQPQTVAAVPQCITVQSKGDGTYTLTNFCPYPVNASFAQPGDGLDASASLLQNETVHEGDTSQAFKMWVCPSPYSAIDLSTNHQNPHYTSSNVACAVGNAGSGS